MNRVNRGVSGVLEEPVCVSVPTPELLLQSGESRADSSGPHPPHTPSHGGNTHQHQGKELGKFWKGNGKKVRGLEMVLERANSVYTTCLNHNVMLVL